jgi:hypothetical protein
MGWLEAGQTSESGRWQIIGHAMVGGSFMPMLESRTESLAGISN